MESEPFRRRLIFGHWLPGPRTWPATMGSAIGSSPKLASGGMTSGWFCLESTLLTLAIAATSFSFYRDRTTHKARKMFHASLLYLPVFMSGIMFHRIVDNQQSLSEENLESSVELSLSSQDGNVKRKTRLRNSTDGSQVRPPVSYASIAPFPFPPVPSYADP